jgi:hypothetical protein
MQAVLNLIWDKLLPAMKPAALPADDAAARKLTDNSGLMLRPQEGSATPAADVYGRKYSLPANAHKLESMSLEKDGEGVILVAKFTAGEQRILCGRGTWKKGRII